MQVIVLTTSCLVLGGIASVVLHRVSKDDEEKAENWNTIVEIGLAALYVFLWGSGGGAHGQKERQMY